MLRYRQPISEELAKRQMKIIHPRWPKKALHFDSNLLPGPLGSEQLLRRQVNFDGCTVKPDNIRIGGDEPPVLFQCPPE